MEPLWDMVCQYVRGQQWEFHALSPYFQSTILAQLETVYVDTNSTLDDCRRWKFSTNGKYKSSTTGMSSGGI